MNINNYFDIVYVVTTKRLKNRHNYITNHLSKFNINFEFIYGPDRKDINIDNYFIADHFKKNKSTQIEIACLISHYNAWHHMINNNYKNCLILEDDCHLHPDFIKNNKLFLENINNINWDIIQYGWLPAKYKNPEDNIINNHVSKQWSFIGGAHCYAIKNNTARILKKNIILFKKDIDLVNIDKLYRKGIINKSIDGYIGDISNPWTKKKKNPNINLQSYRPNDCLAFDCSHGNEFTDIKFSVFALNE